MKDTPAWLDRFAAARLDSDTPFSIISPMDPRDLGTCDFEFVVYMASTLLLYS